LINSLARYLLFYQRNIVGFEQVFQTDDLAGIDVNSFIDPLNQLGIIYCLDIRDIPDKIGRTDSRHTDSSNTLIFIFHSIPTIHEIIQDIFHLLDFYELTLS